MIERKTYPDVKVRGKRKLIDDGRENVGSVRESPRKTKTDREKIRSVRESPRKTKTDREKIRSVRESPRKTKTDPISTRFLGSRSRRTTEKIGVSDKLSKSPVLMPMFFDRFYLKT